MNNLFILLQDQAQPVQGGSPWSSLIFIVLLIVVFWVFFIRPQSKKAKEEQKFREGLQKGDKVVTIGGIHGEICDVQDTTFIIKVDGDVKLKVEKAAIAVDENGTNK